MLAFMPSRFVHNHRGLFSIKTTALLVRNGLLIRIWVLLQFFESFVCQTTVAPIALKLELTSRLLFYRLVGKGVHSLIELLTFLHRKAFVAQWFFYNWRGFVANHLPDTIAHFESGHQTHISNAFPTFKQVLLQQHPLFCVEFPSWEYCIQTWPVLFWHRNLSLPHHECLFDQSIRSEFLSLVQ